MLKKKAKILIRSKRGLCGTSNGCKVLFNVVFLLVTFFALNDVLGQSLAANTKKDSDIDSLRPKVDFTELVTSHPFYNYLMEVSHKEVKVEETVYVAAPNLYIVGLMWGGKLPLAIIEGRVLKVGDTINEFTVEKIDKNGMIVSSKGKSFKIGPPSLVQSNIAFKNQEGGTNAK